MGARTKSEPKAVPDAGALESPGPGLGPLTDLCGIGPKRAHSLGKLGLGAIRDLMLLEPRGLWTWPERVSIETAAQRHGQHVVVHATVTALRLTRLGGRRSIVRVRVGDASGEIDAMFFNQPWMREHMQVGQVVELAGKVIDAKGPALASPKVGTQDKPLPAAGELQAVYPLTEGWTQASLRGLCQNVTREYAAQLVDLVPDDVLAKHDLPCLSDAARAVHLPRCGQTFERGRRRLAFEGLLAVQARLHAERSSRRHGRARAVVLTQREHERIVGRFRIN